MALTVLLDSLVIIGGGYVGMERAQLLAGLGTRVTLVGRLAPLTEPELADVLRAAFAADGVTVVEQRPIRVERTGSDVTVHPTDGRQVRAEQLLVATGRSPQSKGLLPMRQRSTDGRGIIAVADHQRTSKPKIWVAGNVKGTPQFGYVAATAAGRATATNALGVRFGRDAVGVQCRPGRRHGGGRCVDRARRGPGHPAAPPHGSGPLTDPEAIGQTHLPER